MTVNLTYINFFMVLFFYLLFFLFFFYKTQIENISMPSYVVITRC